LGRKGELVKTISELMEGKTPGSVTIKPIHTGRIISFTPYFRTENVWYGINSRAQMEYYRGDTRDWIEVLPPVHKVIVYEWVVRYSDGWYLSTRLLTEEGMEAVLLEGVILEAKKTGREYEVDV
jgi:hypothetical protein